MQRNRMSSWELESVQLVRFAEFSVNLLAGIGDTAISYTVEDVGTQCGAGLFLRSGSKSSKTVPPITPGTFP